MNGEGLRFGHFRFDVAQRQLSRDGVPVRLANRALDILSVLVSARGDVVTKEQLMERVWPGQVVEENNLHVQVSALRKALDYGKGGQSHLVTVPGRGYRLVGLVEASIGDRDRPSIAVLPFQNLSNDPTQEHFADGIVEDITTALGRLRWLLVIARKSSFTYKGRAVDVKQVGRELGVRYLLEGSVRWASKRLRISAQLVDATTGGQHWAERYDLEVDDIFVAQDAITRSVAAAIEPHLLAAEGVRALSHSAGDLGAWELVARAQTHLWRLTRSDHETAVAALKRALDRYPDYAQARSLLGFCLVFAAHMGWSDREQGLSAGRQHALRAVALDDRDPWAHIALGYWAMMERRTEESIAAFRGALNLNPNSAAGHCYLSHILAFAGRDHEAIEHAETAIRLSPLDPEMALFLGPISVAHFVAGRYAEAVQYALETLRLRPDFQGMRRLHCASLAQAGRIDEARASLTAVRRQQPQLSIEWLRASVPYQTPEIMERFLDGMRKAGLDEAHTAK
jgi:TolB-like protein/Flp pilus assembly protein TadD